MSHSEARYSDPAGPACPALVRSERLNGTSITGAPAVNAVLAGHVDTVLANVSEMSSFLEAGKLRALAVTTAQ